MTEAVCGDVDSSIHPVRKFVIDFLRRIVIDSLSVTSPNKSTPVIDVILEVSHLCLMLHVFVGLTETYFLEMHSRDQAGNVFMYNIENRTTPCRVAPHVCSHVASVFVKLTYISRG